MGRGRYPRRIKAGEPGREVARKYLVRWNPRQLYESPQSFPRLDSRNLFGNEHPLFLEVGCGTGDFLCELARQSVGSNFIGIDIARKPIHQAVATAVSYCLDNIKFVRADVRLVYPLLLEGSLQMVYVHFPNPNLRKNQQKRQFINWQFLDHLHQAMRPSGRLSFMTDDSELYSEVMALVREHRGFERVPEEGYHLIMNPRLVSAHQRVWEARGRETLRLELEKVELGRR